MHQLLLCRVRRLRERPAIPPWCGRPKDIATIDCRVVLEIFTVGVFLYYHESPLRGREFVTCKITDSLARIRLGRVRKDGAG